ncbi:response regulator [Marinomonas sp. RS-M-Aa-14]|uniref:response regulator n=1 Tax=Marinomonas sp. RS-M-Aa-14 TaxID=3241169 RepID=UPI00390C4672
MNNLMTDSAMGSDSKATVLIAEDELGIAEILTAYLEKSGMRTLHAANGLQALELHLDYKPDIILLDVQMPKLDGWRVLSEIRHRGNTPVIMLTAMDQDIDKLMGLRTGADDYVVKPFNPAEVVARTQAVLRRTMVKESPAQQILQIGPLHIDIENYSVSVKQETQHKDITLTLTEFKLLTLMARTPKRAYSRTELLENCLPEGDTLERTVDSHISKLRKKLEQVGVHDIPVGVRGIGYRFWDRK